MEKYHFNNTIKGNRMSFIKYLSLIILIIIVLMIIFPKINFRPMPPGLCEGKLPEKMPNWVSSLVPDTDAHYIKPLSITSLPIIAKYIEKCGTKIHITNMDNSNLFAYRQSPVFNFTDWICIRADGHVSASATMGYSDLGKNREWVTMIQNQCS